MCTGRFEVYVNLDVTLVLVDIRSGLLSNLQVVRLFTWVRQREEPFWIRWVGRVRVVCGVRLFVSMKWITLPTRLLLVREYQFSVRYLSKSRARLEERVETCRTPRAHRIWGFVNWLPVQVYAVGESQIRFILLTTSSTRDSERFHSRLGDRIGP